MLFRSIYKETRRSGDNLLNNEFMLSSKKLKALQKYIDILENNKGKTLGEILSNLPGDKHAHFKKGAGGLIVENLLGLDNNSSPKADLEELNIEIKVLPVQLSTMRAKEPTQIKMINFFKVASETWETADLRNKIETIFWIAYGVNKVNGKNVAQSDYVILDWFIDVPNIEAQGVFQKDWELIQSYIIRGDSDMLSCSMGEYIEPKTKGKNNQDKTEAPDGKGGAVRVRRRAFYFKKKYTNKKIISELDFI
jgi:DNA mismatch repair endonuclease MutH